MRSTIPLTKHVYSAYTDSALNTPFSNGLRVSLTVLGVYLDMEAVAEKGNPREARTPWSHKDDSCSTWLPTGKGTRQILTVLSFKHSRALPLPQGTTILLHF